MPRGKSLNHSRGARRGPGKPKPLPAAGDIVWEATGIAAVLGITPRQAVGLIPNLPVRKVGGKWCGSRARLLAHCGGTNTA